MISKPGAKITIGIGAVILFIIGLFDNWFGLGVTIDILIFGFNSSGIFVLSYILFAVFAIVSIAQARRSAF